MTDISLQQLFNEIQVNESKVYLSEWEFEVNRFKRSIVTELNNGNIFCPMCEDTHENNSNCQRND